MSLTKSHQYLNYTDTQASTIAALGNAALVLGGKKAQNLKMIQKSLLFSLVENVIFRKLRFGIFVAFLENGNFSQFLKVEQSLNLQRCERSGPHFNFLSSTFVHFWRRQNSNTSALTQIALFPIKTQIQLLNSLRSLNK